jgi:hypothetical protein
VAACLCSFERFVDFGWDTSGKAGHATEANDATIEFPQVIRKP